MNCKISFYKKHENKLTNTIKLKKMGEFNWAQFGGGAANTLLGTGMGLLLEGHNDRRQLEQQGKLQELQIQGQKQMMDYGMMKQMEMWKNTNYGAQMEQIAAAGLNPALLYGKGGAGGTTTGSPSGSVQGATAPQGGMEIMNMAMQRAQIELLKAQTEKTTAETGSIPTQTKKTEAETGLVIQNIKNAQSQQQYTEAMTAWQNLETKFATQSYHTRQNQIEQQLEQTIQIIRQVGLQNDFTKETWTIAIKQLEQNVIQTQIHSQLLEVQKRATEKGIQLTEAQIQKLTADIAQGWAQLEQGWDKLDLETAQGQRESVKLEQTNMDLLLKEIKTQFDITHPGLWNVAGGQVEKTVNETIKTIKQRIKNTIPKL